MAGPFTIQRLPGLLTDWLGMKAAGTTPADLSPQLQSIIDAGPLYLLDRTEQVQWNTANVNAVGGYPSTTGITGVPQGEVWLAQSCSWYTTSALGAGTSWTIQPCFYTAATGGTYYVPATPGRPPTIATGEFLSLGWMAPDPLGYIMKPGDSVGAWMSAGTFGVLAAVVGLLRFVRLKF